MQSKIRIIIFIQILLLTDFMILQIPSHFYKLMYTYLIIIFKHYELSYQENIKMTFLT